MRRNAAWALGETRHPRRLSSALLEALESRLRDVDPEVRGAAAWALGDIGVPSAPPAVRAMARREQEPRAAALPNRSLAALEAGLGLEALRRRSG